MLFSVMKSFISFCLLYMPFMLHCMSVILLSVFFLLSLLLAFSDSVSFSFGFEHVLEAAEMSPARRCRLLEVGVPLNQL